MTAASSPEDSGRQEFGVQRLYPDTREPYGDVLIFQSYPPVAYMVRGFNAGTYRLLVRDVSEWRNA